jgi:organic radical activating enzyme
MPDLRLFVSEQDYVATAGPDWPSYQDFLAGTKANDAKIQQEIELWAAGQKADGIKFPIRTKTSCQSKWTWSTVFLNTMATSSCHRVNPVAMTKEEARDFHNIPKKLHDRQLMLQGQWPTGGCEYCRDIEMAGGWSDRQHNLAIPDLTPPELETDATAVRVTPRIVEIFAQNTCNFACTYCFASLSSKIEQESKKFGWFRSEGVEIPVYEVPETTKEYFEIFMDWLENHIQDLKRLHLLGGETFLQQDLLQRVLGVIERHPNPGLEFCIFSNLNVPDKLWDLWIPRIKDLADRGHIKRFDLTASIDCWGAEAEYARFGLDLAKFEERFAWAADQDPDWLRLNVNQTVTCLTMRTMPDLIDKIRKYSKNRHIGHYFQFYTGPQMWQHPKTYAYDFWNETFDEIFRAMPKDTPEQLEAIPRMQGLQAYLKTFKDHNWTDIRNLHIFLDELDRRRNTDWRRVFPYLDIKAATS